MGLAFRVDFGLKALAVLDRNLGNPDDGRAGSDAVAGLKHGNLAREYDPPLSGRLPDLHVARSQLDRIGGRLRLPGRLVLCPRGGRERDRENEA